MVFDNNKKKIFLIIFIVVIINVVVLFFISKEIQENSLCRQNESQQIQQLRLNDNELALINPLLACDTQNNNEYYELSSLKKKLENLILKQKNQGLAKRVSVYYRNLNNGHWTGIKEDEKYVPASLIKVPLLIAYMKKAEKNPEILDQKYIYNGTDDADRRQATQKPLTPFIMGHAYTVYELLYRMIVYSGNNSQIILAQSIDQDFMRDVYSDLGLSHTDFERPRSMENSISPKTFATFFRILYNASYLNYQYSEKALGLMTDATFKNGIVAGLPENIKVAHKFGERTILDGVSNEVILRELHDCGIIYNSSKPYLLCIMTQGDDFNGLESVISQISNFIFEYGQD